MVLAAAEAGLRIFGFGYPTQFFVPLGDVTVTTNPRFARQFMRHESSLAPYPVAMPVQKPPGTRRIFVLGESAAQGTPAPAFGFIRILEFMLQQQFPEQHFEVVNAAMRGVNSHVLLPIAQDCAKYSPDLFLVYAGNNESIGLYAPEPEGFNVTPYLHLLRWGQSIKASRLAQGIERLARSIRRPVPNPEKDMEFFRRQRLGADDPRRAAVYENFRANLDDICGVARSVGANVILSTVAVNLGGFPPLGSLHKPGWAPDQHEAWKTAFEKGTNAEAQGRLEEAITNYLAARNLDDHFAELHYRFALCLQAQGKFDEARQSFSDARDWDALMFRTDHRLNQITRDVASARSDRGVTLIDAEKALTEAARDEHGIVGTQFFHDHVHLNFDGDYALASAFLPAVATSLGLMGGTARLHPLPTRAECATALGLSLWDELGLDAASVRSLSRPPFLDQLDHARRQAAAEALVRQRTEDVQKKNGFQRSAETYRSALARRPNDWQILYNYGSLLSDFGQRNPAVEQFTASVRLMAAFPPLRVALAQSLWVSGNHGAAVEQLKEALRLDPDYLPAKDALAKVSKQPRKH